MKRAWLLLVVVGSFGCQSAPPETENAAQPSPNASSPASGESGVSPMATPVPNGPVTGTESLQGGGSAVGTVAKDRAKEAAARASAPAGSAGTSEENPE